ncbi:MAG: FIST signal transduction protein [Bacteroidia bacterium]
MRVIQAHYTSQNSWHYLNTRQELKKPLVLVFASRLLLDDQSVLKEITTEFPYNDIVYVSTAGEILDENLYENSVTVTAIEFEKISFRITTAHISDFNDNATEMAKSLCNALPAGDLKHLLVFASGNFLNGSALVEGFEELAEMNLPITGGLSGDDSRFEKTVAGYNTPPQEGIAVIVGLYGGNPEITYASLGGFQPLGPNRLVTKADKNVVYEIDGKPALDLYKAYLGDRVMQKMESLLAFPLQVAAPGKKFHAVRTVLQIDTEDGSIVLAGNCPEGSQVQLLMASVNGIIDGATEAARQASATRKAKPEFALLVSCMGRKAIMGMRIEEELEIVRELLGPETAMAGFYSYAEIAPFYGSSVCELHNQTLTLTLISE